MFKNYLKFIIFFVFLAGNSVGAEKEGMPQLDTNYWISQIFWVTLIFIALYLILWRKILPKINEENVVLL